jgi:hypothetical protein
MKSNRRAEEQRQIEIETRQAQLLMQLYDRYNDAEFRKAVHAVLFQTWDQSTFIEQYPLIERYDQFAPTDIVISFFEGIGVLVRRGLVDIALIEDLLQVHTVATWDKMEPIIQGIRRLVGDTRTLRNFEYLYTTIKQREQAPTLST